MKEIVGAVFAKKGEVRLSVKSVSQTLHISTRLCTVARRTDASKIQTHPFASKRT